MFHFKIQCQNTRQRLMYQYKFDLFSLLSMNIKFTENNSNGAFFIVGYNSYRCRRVVMIERYDHATACYVALSQFYNNLTISLLIINQIDWIQSLTNHKYFLLKILVSSILLIQ